MKYHWFIHDPYRKPQLIFVAAFSTFSFIQIDFMQIYKMTFFSGGHQMKQNAIEMLLRS